MPFRSEKQRRFLWKNKPKIAKRWSKKYGSKIKKKKGYNFRQAERKLGVVNQ